jgi:hypothetical protein
MKAAKVVRRSKPGLPDGFFPTIWNILRPFGIFYGHLGYFTAIWDILRPFGIFYGHLVKIYDRLYSMWSFGIFLPFWCVWTKTNLATLLRTFFN